MCIFPSCRDDSILSLKSSFRENRTHASHPCSSTGLLVMCCEVFPPGTPDYEAMASLGRMVAQCGPGIEDVVRQRKTQDPNLWYAGTPRYQIKSIIIIPHAFVISVSFLLVFVRSRDD